MKLIIYYFKIWMMIAKNSFLVWLVNKNGIIIFLIGKLIRFSFYFGFIFLLVKNTNGFAGYSGNQAIFFMATYVLIDTIAQFFFRNVYNFRRLVVTGDLDLILTKPINPLFRVLMGGPDLIDVITIPIITIVVVYTGSFLNPTLIQIFYYLLLVINGLIIAIAFHIFVLTLGIITFEIDHTIMVYRDLVSMGRLPIDVYKEPFKSILTFIVPVGVMITIPAKALMGLIGPMGIVSSILFGVALLFLSIKFWHFGLKKYSSASS